VATDPLRTRLCEEFGLEFPVIAFSHCKDVVVAVTKAGGLGILGAGAGNPETMEQDIKWIRERVGNKAFGVDLLIPASVPPSGTYEELRAQIPEQYWAWIEEQMRLHGIPKPKPRPAEGDGAQRARQGAHTQESMRRSMEALLELRPPIFAAGLGNPAWVLEEAHRRGIKVFGLVGNVRQAVREAESGIDYIVAQGYDAGGHTGEIGTFSLVPQVVNAVHPTPVVSAGGVGTGKHLVAALAMGCVGVWTGTIWLTSTESDTDMVIKEKILAATERDTVRTRASSGKPMRQLRSRWSDMWEQPGAPPPLPYPLQGMLIRDFQQSVRENRLTEWWTSPAGQVVGTITKIKPCAEILYDMVSEAQEILERLAYTGVSEL
jgi:NAD(P)H-dependent flavin oxidoreductase YrpB (nitropropane dioxygenase family)